MAMKANSAITVRKATAADLNDIAAMLEDFVAAHPAKSHVRPLSRLRDAYLGDSPVAHLLVATRNGRVVGMAQWTRIYDLFWAMFGGAVEGLYVRPEARGLGIPAALVAEICRQVRDAGGEFLTGGAESKANAALYERVAIAWDSRTCNVSGEGFRQFADLAGLAPREIVRRLPHADLSRIPAQLRPKRKGRP